MRLLTSLGAAAAFALLLFAGLGCGHHDDDNGGRDRHVYREPVRYHDDLGYREYRDGDHDRRERRDRHW